MSFIVLAAILAAASALPTEFATRSNVTRFERVLGFGASTIGGQGGAIWTVWDPWALQNAISTHEPRIIYVRGHIDLTALFTGSPGVRLFTGSWKTIIGGDANAVIYGGGLYIRDEYQIIVQNIRFHNALSYAPGEQPNGHGGIISQIPGAWSTVDAITMDNAWYVWVDHCEFADDPWISVNVPESQRRHNTLIGMIRGPTWITISNSIFRNHYFCILTGAGDDAAATDAGKLKTTFYGNWFMGCNQRNPFVRFGEVHVYNNLYTDIPEYAVGVGIYASVYVERNVFLNVRRAFAGDSNPPGHILDVENILVNSGMDAGIPNDVRWRPSDYYWYSSLPASSVEWSVRTHAGVW